MRAQMNNENGTDMPFVPYGLIVVLFENEKIGDAVDVVKSMEKDG